MLDREGGRGAVGPRNRWAMRIGYAARSSAWKTSASPIFNAAIMDVEAGAYDRTLEFLASLKG